MHRRPLEQRQVSPVKHRSGEGKSDREHAARIAGLPQNAYGQVGVCILLVLPVAFQHIELPGRS